MSLNSIQRRVFAAMVISELVLALALAALAITYIRHRLLTAFDAGLQGRAMSVAALVRYEDDASTGIAFTRELLPPNLESSGSDLFEIVSSGSGLVGRSEPWPRDLKLPSGSWAAEVWANGHRYRGIRLTSVPVMDEDQPASPIRLSIFYAARTNSIDRDLVQATAFIAASTFLILLLSSAIGAWGIRRGLTPLRSLAQQAASVSPRNWGVEVDSTEQPAELKPLTQALADMLARLRASFVQQREFIGNAAHELKTPVAIVKSSLQGLLMKPRSFQECRAGLEEALEDVERLERLVQWMLRLARTEQWAQESLREDLSIVDLADTCEEAIARARGLARLRGVSLQMFRNGSPLLRADPEDLQLIWVNLLENAIRYSPQQGTVELHAGGSENLARVRVVDYGAGIPADEIPRIFERFHRGDLSRARDTGGFGLGLALAKAFAEAYGGSIHLSSVLGQGTSVVVELPLVKTE